MTGPLASLGHMWVDLIDGAADFQSAMLRRTAGEMAGALDLAARRDIEGAKEWRDLEAKEDRYASTRP